MRISVKKGVGSCLLSAFLLFPQEGFTVDNTWLGSSSSDLNTAANWSLGHIPAAGEVALFNSAVASNFNPTATTAFTVDAFQFNPSAQPFSFTFSQAPLMFNAGGILGTPSNTTMTLNNLNNGTSIASQLLFDNVPSSLGAANVSLVNVGSASTNTSNGVLTAQQLLAAFNFSLSDGAALSCSNSGTDTSSGTAQSIGSVGSSQMEFDQNLTVGTSVRVSATNTGLDNGSATTNNTGFINGPQFVTTGAFSSGDNLALEASNSGTSNNGSVTGGSNVGYINGSQINFQSTFDVGNNVNLLATNSATDNSVGPSNSTGTLGATQIAFGGPVGSINPSSSGLVINANNTANATAGAGFKFAGFIDNNQVEFANTFVTGNNANLTLTNSGTYDGTYTNAGSTIGCVRNTGFSADSSFQAGDGFVLSVENTGVDHSIGGGGNSVGDYINNSQAQFFSSLQLGDNALLSFTNSGTYDGQNSTAGNNVGYIGNFQVHFPATAIQAGDNFNLTVSNTGIDSSQGFGGNFVGSANSTQLEIDGAGPNPSMILGDHATITLTNSGTFSGSTSVQSNFVGYFGNPQLSLNVPLQTGDNFSLIVTNVGNNSSSGAGGNDIGFIDDPQTEYGPVSVGNNALFQVSNTGVDSSSSNMGNNNQTAVIESQQANFYTFNALDNLTIEVSNSGTQTGGVSNTVGFVLASQLEFGGLAEIGSNGTIAVTNTSVNDSPTGTVGTVLGYQFVADTDFTAGNNLKLTATNDVTGTPSPNGGFVTLGQAGFLGNCTLGDGSVISVANEGIGIIGNTIPPPGNQMFFAQGFTINGTASLLASNSPQGTVTGHGISIAGGSGGNALIFLDNTDLNISSPNATFTIGGLNGNNTAIAASLPEMIINLAPTTSATFAGTIEDYGIAQPTVLQIAGSGVQTLTGNSTFTGETSVVGGTLILNGTIPGNISVDGLGTLKGSGTAGSASINGGVIAPGQSIGTLHFTNFTNNGGTYDVEVNGAGQSDLIDVAATATLNGGVVEVSSVDGTYAYQKRYTIVEAGSVNGQFTSAFGVSPFIRPVVTYDPQHVYLEIFTNFAGVANTHNQRAVADQLDGIIDPTSLQTQLLNEIASLSPQAAQSALDSLSGWQYTSNFWVAELVNNNFIKRLYDGIRPIVTDPNCRCSCSDSFTAWIEGGATFKDLQGNSNAHGFSSSGGEVTLGMHKTFQEDWTVGVAASYEYDHLRYKFSGGSSNFNTGLGGLYALYRPDCFYVFSDLAYGYSSTDMNRKMEVGPLTFTGKSHPNIQQLTFYGEVGMDWTLASVMLVQPFFGLVAGETWCSRVIEQPAGGWELGIAKKDRALVETRLGVHLTTPRLCAFACSIDLAWAKRITGSNSFVDGQFLQFGTPFEIDGVSLASNSFDYAITFSKGINGCLLYLQASGQAWSHANDVDVLAGVQYTW